MLSTSKKRYHKAITESNENFCCSILRSNWSRLNRNFSSSIFHFDFNKYLYFERNLTCSVSPTLKSLSKNTLLYLYCRRRSMDLRHQKQHGHNGHRAANAEPHHDHQGQQWGGAGQGKEESLNRRENEKIRNTGSKDRQHQEFRRRNGHIYQYCETCSEFCSSSRKFMRVITHKHFSSIKYRLQAPIDENGNYPCTQCRDTPHSFKTGRRYSVLLSSSTLHQWQGARTINRYKGDEIHVEQLTIPGATIEDIRHALEAEFKGTYRCIDVLAVVGLNDVMRGRSREQIIADYTRLQNTVHELAPQEGGTNSIAIATMIIPPKIVQRGGGQLEKMVGINAAIMHMNQEQSQTRPVKLAPKFHTWGRTGERSYVNQARPRMLLAGTDQIRNGQWREDEDTRKLHLSDAARLRMGRACVGYFLALNGITPCLAPTKEEGLKIENNTSERLASSFHTDGPVWTAARGRRGRGGWRGGWRGGRGAGGRGGRGRGEARGRGFYCNGT